ncbi:hypothetical protein [Falsirhodobacter sp. 1013]|uniref:calcium-binding protein n=1 Tax=Falsirhodobacter sp. 1013 TaxID=3417566 RepID=UPI003EBF485B
MASLTYSLTFTGSRTSLLTGITDLVLAQSGDTTVLYAASAVGSGLSAFALSDSGLSTLWQGVIRGTPAVGQSPELAVAGGQVVVTGYRGDSLPTYAVSGNGSLKAVDDLETGMAVGDALAVTVGAETFLYATSATENEITTFAWGGGPALSTTPTTGAGALRGGAAATTGDMLSVEVDGNTYLVTTDMTDGRVYTWKVNSDGSLKPGGSIGATEGLGLATPDSLALATLGGRTFLIVGSSGSSSLSVVEMGGDGTLIPRDQVIDDLGTRFDNVTAMTTVEAGGRVYVLAAGADDGLTLMMLLPDGTLRHLSTLEDTADRLLSDISALSAVADGDRLRIFAASGSERGLAELTVDLSKAGLNLYGGGKKNALTGGNKDDVLWGDAHHDTLSGGAGDDILMDGAGRDRLTGGAGADVFVLAADGEHDTILDFDPAQDRLDLSRWVMMHGPDQLAVEVLSNGAILRFGSEVLYVYTANGSPLTVDAIRTLQLTDAMSRVPIIPAEPPPPPTVGGPGDDTLKGGKEDDTLEGGGGADTLIGGGGSDWASYARATAGVHANLTAPRHNTGEAAGDVYDGIRNFIGSDHDDRLQGDAEANILMGGSGDDFLVGAAGNDRLDGDDGDDRFVGGAGADTMNGGEGRDTVDYRDSKFGITIDLGRPANNTGIAAGDVFQSIEDVAGGRRRDTIIGTDAANKLVGAAGDDHLDGGAGDDTLEGGVGNDTFAGGLGSDLMDGDAGSDTVTYSSSTAGLQVDLMNTARNTGLAAGDRHVAIENLIGGKGSDTLYGNNADNVIQGGGGHDALYGRRGDDTLTGGAGNDTLSGDIGADHLSGGAGRDAASYASATAKVRVDLANPGHNTGYAAGDTFSSIEDLIGSRGNDTLLGNGAGNRIFGGDGNDNLQGRSGNDTIDGGLGHDLLAGDDGNDVLYGGAGNDTLTGDKGADALFGGDGVDLADYRLAQGGLLVDMENPALNTGFATGDTYASIEGLGGGSGHDTLFGDEMDNLLSGAAGNDQLNGRGGADRLSGGRGNDTLTGGAGSDTFIFDSGKDTITDFDPAMDGLVFDRELLDGRTLSQFLASQKVIDGSVTLVFDEAHTLTLNGIRDAAALFEDIVLG